MKTLMLLRHAKSGWDDPLMSDFDRHLNHIGRAAAERMGKAVREQGLEFDAAVVSPALRAVETAEGFGKGYGSALPARLEPRIYLAAVDSLADLVRETDDDVVRLLVIGHSPGLERLALFAARAEGSLREKVAGDFPTASFVQLQLEIERWSELDEGVGSISLFLSPRDFDPASED